MPNAKRVVNDFGGSNPPSPTIAQSLAITTIVGLVAFLGGCGCKKKAPLFNIFLTLSFLK